MISGLALIEIESVNEMEQSSLTHFKHLAHMNTAQGENDLQNLSDQWVT